MDGIINATPAIPFDSVREYEERYELKQKHDQLLEILVAFDQVCRAHDIQYSLADGTLLGAMRHGDFIPWDDDADVMVTREQYEKLRAIIERTDAIRLIKVCFLDRILIDCYADEGVYVDLFINEDMPANKVLFAWKKFATGVLRCYFSGRDLRNVRHDKYSKGKKTLHRLSSGALRFLAALVIGRRDVFDLNDRAVDIKGRRPSGFYTRYTSRMYETKRRFDKQKYDAGYCDVAFRGHTLRAICNVNTFLHEMYGDYMKLLPEHKRKPEHPVNMMDSPKRCIKRFN